MDPLSLLSDCDSADLTKLDSLEVGRPRWSGGVASHFSRGVVSGMAMWNNHGIDGLKSEQKSAVGRDLTVVLATTKVWGVLDQSEARSVAYTTTTVDFWSLLIEARNP